MSAVAPYNFVELPSRIIPAEEEALRPVADRYDPTRHNGWLELEMTALTPLYTRGVLGTGGGFPQPIATVNQGETVQVADFFHRGEHSDPRLCRPILPGSSLRGMFESVFEIMAQSRPRFVSSHRPFYRYFAAGQPELRQFYADEFSAPANLVAGILRRRHTPKGEQWYLEVSNHISAGLPARGFVAVSVQSLPPSHYYLRSRRSGNDVYTARQQDVTVTGHPAALLQGAQALTVPEAEFSKRGISGALSGYLILPGPDLNRPPPHQREPARSWYQVILDPLSAHGSREYLVPEEIYSDYLEWGRTAHGQRFSKNNKEAPRQLLDGSPTFALISAQNPNEVSTIGANMMLSLRHTDSPKEVAQRSYQASLPVVDMAQALFGYVPTASEAAEGAEAIRGRVFVEDAECVSTTWYLSSDDPVQVPPPLLGPKITALQMYLKQTEQPLQHYSSAKARARGYKRYWHRTDDVALAMLRTDDGLIASTETRICPVTSKTKFIGRVRFENLTDAELGGLYACIQLPWDQKQRICLAHKFGMGKGFGLGSLRVKETRIVLVDMQKRYNTFRRSFAGSIAGQIPEAEARQRLSKAYQAFVERVGKNKTLWRRLSMKALANLLAWEPSPQGEIRTVGVEINPNKPGFDPLARQWKDRVPLGDVVNRIENLVLDVIPFVSANEEVSIKPIVSSASEQTANIPQVLAPPAKKPRAFSIGNEVIVTVQRRFGRFQGDVLVDDGTSEGRLLRNVQIGDASADDELRMIITAVNGDGVVTGVKRGYIA